LVTTST